MEFILLFAEKNQDAITKVLVFLVGLGMREVFKAAWKISKAAGILAVKAATNLYQTVQQKRRIRKSKDAILQFLTDHEIVIPIRSYEAALAENSGAAGKHRLGNTPPEAEWATDLIKATALAELRDAGKIIRPKVHPDNSNSFPTSADWFIFRTPENGRTVEEQELEIEEESACRNAQQFGRCEKPARYEWEGVTKTLGPGRSQPSLRYWKIANAPKCARCWEQRKHRHDICMLVADLLHNELSSSPSTAGIRDIQTFAEICAEICITENIPAEVGAVTKAITVQVGKAAQQNSEGSGASHHQPDQVEHRYSVSKEDLLHKFDATYTW